MKYMTIVVVLVISVVQLSGHEGFVRVGEIPVPGVSVQATRGDKTLSAVTDTNGRYVLPELGVSQSETWTIRVEMPGFETLQREVTVWKDDAPLDWRLKMRSLAEINGERSIGFPKEPTVGTPRLQLSPSPPEAVSGLLINGSVNNGAGTTAGLAVGFGNNRKASSQFPYKGSVSISGSNSLLDARPFSLTGQNTPTPAYHRLTGSVTLQGPLKIPHLLRRGQFNVNYNRTQNRNASVQTGLMPTAAERVGDFSASSKVPIDPATGSPFLNGVIPQDQISPQARTLVDLYPLPNFTSGTRYNYQIPIVGVTHGDSLQGSVSGFRFGADTLSAGGTFTRMRSDDPDLLGFMDTTNTKSVSTTVTWVHRFTPRFAANIRYAFSRNVSETLPHFGKRLDISGMAGITGNDRDPRNWGPPALSFAGGIGRLSSGSYRFDRNQSSTVGYASTWVYRRHAFGYGVDHQWQQFNLLSQRDARGNFTFTGAETGNDFADFLLGVPTAASLAFGNPDKYFRQRVMNAYITNDFRILSTVTVNIGLRWEYESPITEKYGRLVNLDIPSDFTSADPVVAGDLRNSLVRADRSGFQPRIGLAWRPWTARSTVIRAGYGIYRDTSVYRAIADQMAQQSPLSKSFSVQNTPSNPLTLADGFRGSPLAMATTFAIDPNFHPGTAQNWSLSIQQNLPAMMVMTLTYLGIKGTHVPQRLLPNTFAEGTVKPCPSCPAGFVYLTSSGNSNRHSGTIEVRRRQRNGFEAGVTYTFAKAIDDAGLGGSHIVQNWLDRRAERGLSNFDQRHQFTAQAQFTSGMLLGIGGFWDSWRGAILKEWTISGQLTIGSGTPLTPLILAPVRGTGVTGTLRPNVTGIPIPLDSGGSFLNPAAFTLPATGEWGNSARNSIAGPGQFSLNASVQRGFQLTERFSVDLRVTATNVLNHVTYASWNTTINSAQFGAPTRANAMRTIQPSVVVRF